MTDNCCPSCAAILLAEDINIAEGAALCPECGLLSRLRDVLACRRPDEKLLTEIPTGCSATYEGRELRLRASLRSVGSALGALFACLFWNGIVSIFVLLAFAGVYVNFVGPLPDWFPVPNQEIGKGESLFLCVFLIPFVTIGMFLFLRVPTLLFGRIEARINDDNAVICTGIGPFVWRKTFDPRAVTNIGEEDSSTEVNGRKQKLVRIECDAKKTEFGTMLTEERRVWFQQVLSAVLLPRWKNLREEFLARLPLGA